MAYGSRILQHWDQWLAQSFLGQAVVDVEKDWVLRLLNVHFGKQLLLIGVPCQDTLLRQLSFPYKTLITPLIKQDKIKKDTYKNIYTIEADFYELPLLTASIDAVIIPHTLELIDNPRQLLAEACRVIKPEGLILISGFNPYSVWGLQKLWMHYTHNQSGIPWNTNFIRSSMIKRWLELADFKMEQQYSALFTPPIHRQTIYHRFSWIEKVGKMCFPACGGIYFIVARAKVIPLTPIKLKWKQELSQVGLSTTIPGNLIR